MWRKASLGMPMLEVDDGWCWMLRRCGNETSVSHAGRGLTSAWKEHEWSYDLYTTST